MPFSFRPAPKGPSQQPTTETLATVLAAVRGLYVEPGRLVTDVLAGGFRSTFRGGGVEFSDVREYVEGDDPRAVDWNVTARFGRPFVKRFVEERERTLVFVFDLQPTMACGFGAWSLRQAAARLCACLGLMAIENHDRVGLLMGNAGRLRMVLPKKGAGHVLRIVRDCVEAPCRGDASSVDAMLAHVAGRLRRRAVVFVLSDFAGHAPLPSLVGCAKHHDVVAVRLLANELRTPPHTLLRAHDPVSGRSVMVDFAATAVRTAWQQRVQNWLGLRHEQFQRAGVDCMDIEVPAVADLAAISGPLARFFRRRSLRQVRR